MPSVLSPQVLPVPGTPVAAPRFPGAGELPGQDVPRGPSAEELYRSINEGYPQSRTGLEPGERAELWNAAFSHEVAGLDDPRKLEKYDPDGIIGFCFGRAMAVELMARKMGLARESIRKLFILGDLRSGPDPEWRFHVATLIRGSDGGWHAVDPILDGPMPVQDWISTVRGVWDKAGAANLYLAPAGAVIPDIHTVPEDISKESGQRLIELSFNPAGRPGFEAVAELGPRAYSLGDAALQEHFISAGAAAVPSFDFEGITINGGRISYNGYFEALLNSLAAGVPTRLQSPRRALKGGGLKALGLRAGRLFRGNAAP